ncbi:SDR family oxidoreductase [Streptomyces sp. NPDC088341]|uniref:SDR family oxidoreductase n=1 Tax=Streptomyces sp. NPDC088341 TaxID=3154870 RepID=UPI003413C849
MTIDALTLPLAQHLGPRGITVNTVVPATTDTDLNASWLRGKSELIASSPRRTQNAEHPRPHRRPADIADVVALLASLDARWITGQVIDATGGFRR